jgi:hypothetical protein
MSNIAQVVVDTLSNKPEIGIFASMTGVALSPTAIISLISAIIGLLVAVITVIIKIMDLYHKMKRRGNVLMDDEYVLIDGKRYKKEEVQEEE